MFLPSCRFPLLTSTVIAVLHVTYVCDNRGKPSYESVDAIGVCHKYPQGENKQGRKRHPESEFALLTVVLPGMQLPL